jgi:AraC family transcriptional regulator, transcriptional activator of pobA
MNNMTAHIRISTLPEPFVYRTMEAIEAVRTSGRELPHRHDFFTVMVVEQGDGLHQIDFKDHVLADNTLYFIAPEQVHHVELKEGTSLRGHVVMFTDDFLLQHSLSPARLTELELFFNCYEAKPLSLELSDMQVLLPHLEQIQTEYHSPSPERFEMLGALLKLLLLECRRLKRQKVVVNQPLEHRQATIVRQFKNEVERKFTTWHQVADYAQAQNLTANYLNEIIKAETGSSAKSIIQDRLVLEAKRLALYSDLSAKEVAFTLGYEDVAHFSKFFKKCVGVNFSIFRDSSNV